MEQVGRYGAKVIDGIADKVAEYAGLHDNAIDVLIPPGAKVAVIDLNALGAKPNSEERINILSDVTVPIDLWTGSGTMPPQVSIYKGDPSDYYKGRDPKDGYVIYNNYGVKVIAGEVTFDDKGNPTNKFKQRTDKHMLNGVTVYTPDR